MTASGVNELAPFEAEGSPFPDDDYPASGIRTVLRRLARSDPHKNDEEHQTHSEDGSDYPTHNNSFPKRVPIRDIFCTNS